MGVLVMTATDAQKRTRELVRDNDIAIDLIAEGGGRSLKTCDISAW